MFVTVVLWLLCLSLAVCCYTVRAFCVRNPVIAHVLLVTLRAWVRSSLQRLWGKRQPKLDCSDSSDSSDSSVSSVSTDSEPDVADYVDEPGDLKILEVQEDPTHVLVKYAYRNMRYAMALGPQFLHELSAEDDFDPAAIVVEVLRAQKPRGDIVLNIQRSTGKVTDHEHEEVVKLFGPFGHVQDVEGFFLALDAKQLFCSQLKCTMAREPIYVTCLDHVFVLDFENQAIIRESREE